MTIKKELPHEVWVIMENGEPNHFCYSEDRAYEVLEELERDFPDKYYRVEQLERYNG